MAITHKISVRINYNQTAVTWDASQTTGAESNMSESIPDASTDLQVTWEADVSEMKSLLMLASGGNITVETNSGSTPTDTISLTDGVPVLWVSGNNVANPLTADVTTDIYVTNSSGSDVTLTILSATDPTP